MRPINVPPPFASPLTCQLADGVLAPSACQAIVEAATRVGFEATAGLYPPSYRDNDRIVFDDPPLASALYERVRALLPSELTTSEGAVRLVGLNSRFRMCRYRDGQSFRVHRDGAHAPSPGVRSRLTLQIYLDEAFSGGATRFYAARAGARVGSVVPRTGTAIIFDHDLWHDGEAVTRGTKHVLRVDVLYARERMVNASTNVAPSTAEPSVLCGHEGYVFAVTALSDGAIASGGRDRAVRVWEPDAEGKFACRLVATGHHASVTALSETSRGAVLSTSRDKTVRVLDRHTGRQRTVATLGGAGLALAPIRGGFACGVADGSIALIDDPDAAPSTSARRAVLMGHHGWVWALVMLPDGRLVSGSEDGTLRAWDLATRECVAAAAPRRGPVHALCVMPDGRVAAGFADGHVVIYAMTRSFDPVAVLAAHEGEVYALAALGEDLLASGGEDGCARVCRVSDRAERSLVSCDAFVRAVARIPGSRRIAVGGYDGRVRIAKVEPPHAGRSSVLGGLHDA